MDGDARVKVFVRIRPKLQGAVNALHSNERHHPDAVQRVNDDVVRAVDESRTTSIGEKDIKVTTFAFDGVFDHETPQEELYEATTLDAVDAALQGKNVSVITYGQTGSGKTFTVLGSVGNNPIAGDDALVQANTGLFLRVLADIFRFQRSQSHTHVVVALSVMEVYLESVRDLLGRDPTAAIRVAVGDDSVQLPELTVRGIQSLRDAVKVYHTASGRRVSRATDSNDSSSRSHALFTVDIYQQPVTSSNPEPPTLEAILAARERPPAPAAGRGFQRTASTTPPSPSTSNGSTFSVVAGQPPVVHSKIVLTDLAGSEKMRSANSKGDALEEMKKINGSLTALGNVVHALYEGARHVPYRDTRLTVLLRSCFASPDSRVVLIANVAPTSLTLDETMSTLFFANKVKALKAAGLPAGAGAEFRLAAALLDAQRMVEELGADLRICAAANAPPPDVPGGPFPTLGLTRRMLRGKAGADRVAHLRAEAARLGANQRQRELEENDAEVHRRARESVDDHRALKNRRATEINELRARREDGGVLDTSLAAARATEDRSAAESQQRVTAARDRRAALTAEQTAVRTTLMGVNEKCAAMDAEFRRRYASVEEAWEAESAHFERQEQVHDTVVAINRLVGLHRKTQQGALAGRQEVETKRTELAAAARGAVPSRGSHADPMARPPAPPPPRRSLGSASSASTSTDADGRPLPPRSRPPRKPEPELGIRAPPSPFDSQTLISDVISYAQTGATLIKHGRAGRPHARFFWVQMPPQAEGSASPTQGGGSVGRSSTPLPAASMRSGTPMTASFARSSSVSASTPGSPTNSSLGGGSGGPCVAPRLMWVDEPQEDRRRNFAAAVKNGSFVDLSTVTDIVLGRFTEVFQRNRAEGDDFYISFSVRYRRQEMFDRTLDVVCASDAEMEAWVLALASLCRLTPRYGGLMTPLPPLPVDLPPLDAAATALCHEWHVRPQVYATVARRLRTALDRASRPTLYLTPGDLRYITHMDIFRTSAMLYHFAALGLISVAPEARNYLDYASSSPFLMSA
jgi:hypothetical protein